MKTKPKKLVALVTGASSGIGKATAQLLYQQGWIVYGLSRSGAVPIGVHALRADVTLLEELRAVVAKIWQQHGQLDAVVHAAGIGGAGSVENFPLREARKIMETNFMGALHMAQVVLPYLREQGAGKLLYISSIAGLMGIPFHGIYAASKFAVEGLVESLRLELVDTRVAVVSVCPGDTATPILTKQYRARAEDLPLIYRRNYQHTDQVMAQSVAAGVSASQVAADILRIIKLKSPKVRYAVGEWLQKISPLLKCWLPMRYFERIMVRYYGLTKREHVQS
ncbi:MAG: SDR family oxidoreductase [Bacteroidetes bacterium]|nr:MAG: SDR family oxidoreductase [Bacteroidota bacterium]